MHYKTMHLEHSVRALASTLVGVELPEHLLEHIVRKARRRPRHYLVPRGEIEARVKRRFRRIMGGAGAPPRRSSSRDSAGRGPADSASHLTR